MSRPDLDRKILSRGKLGEVRRRHAGQRIVFCSGCFDVFHAGHTVFFNQCAALGDILVAGVARDSTARTLKGDGRPVNPEKNRLYLVANIQAVDYALLNDEFQGNSDEIQILKDLRPDVFAVIEGDPRAITTEAAICRQLGIQLVFLPRDVPEGLILSSTSEILGKLQRESGGKP
jgi:D-beta-D-heptose 7-phosphate kinase/D-beta-D-heptose 1-phosphate adenosyltransferase